MITAFATTAQVLDRPEYAATAERAATFILSRMRANDGRLLRTWSQGSEPKLNGYLEDYAFLLDGLVTLYEASFELHWIAAALDLAGVMIEQFWDAEDGACVFTGRDHEALIARTKEATDSSTPSGQQRHGGDGLAAAGPA